MATLEDDFPEVYAHFEKGHHVLRRSDRFWAGLSTDLVIEQSLMRSLKTSGGLSRGRGFTEAQRLTWLMSRPVCLSVNSAMQELESVTYVSSEQHKEASRPRVKRDGEDVELILTFLRERSPFDGTIPLRNIATGLVASDSVNCYNARNVGIDILNKMKGKSVVEYTFRKKDRVVNMNRNTIKVANSDINIDPQLLFQRFASCSINDENIQEVFSHELCAYPASLFEAKDVLREPDKPALTDGIWNKLPSDARCSPSDLPSGTRCVVDGGWLLHRVPWKKCSTFGEICQSYVALLNNKYSGGIVCFDGYTHNTTKDAVHRRQIRPNSMYRCFCRGAPYFGCEER